MIARGYAVLIAASWFMAGFCAALATGWSVPK